MRKTPPRIDRSRVRTIPARRRPSKVQLRSEARPHQPGAPFTAFLDGLPDLLGARDLRDGDDGVGAVGLGDEGLKGR